MREEILKDLKELLETEDTLTEDMKLQSVAEWDSLAALSLIVTAQKKYSKSISGNDIKSCETFKDIIDLLV